MNINSLDRAKTFGLDDIRGIAYKPGPLAIDGSQNPQKDGGSYFENIKDGQDVKYTIYYDSDFYNSDFDQLWSGNNGGRDDLRRFKEQLNVNFVHLYDWNPGTQAGAANGGKMRNHIPFLNYADSLGIKVTIPISNDQLKNAYCTMQTGCRSSSRSRWANPTACLAAACCRRRGLSLHRILRRCNDQGHGFCLWDLVFVPIVA